MKEARRLSLKRSTPVPIFPYTQYLYERSQLFLNMVSVVNVYHTKTTFNTYLFTLKIPQIIIRMFHNFDVPITKELKLH